MAFRRLLMAGALLVISGIAGTSCQASTVVSFEFRQGGYVSPYFLSTGTLVGVFTGTIESNGYLSTADLSKFEIKFVEHDSGQDMEWSIGDLRYGNLLFSFYADGPPFDPGSLDIRIGAVRNACIGAAAAFGACNKPITGHRGVVDLDNLKFFFTDEAPVVTMVSSITTAVPEPSTWAMMLIGFCGLVLFAHRRKNAEGGHSAPATRRIHANSVANQSR